MPKTTKGRRITITLEEDVFSSIGRLAEVKNTSISKVISSFIPSADVIEKTLKYQSLLSYVPQEKLNEFMGNVLDGMAKELFKDNELVDISLKTKKSGDKKTAT